MDSDDSSSYVGHDIIHEDPDSPAEAEATGEGAEGGVGNSAHVASRWASRIMTRMALGLQAYAAHEASAEALQEGNAAEDLGQDVAPENQDSSDRIYDADTISDSPNSTSSTFKLNVSSDSSSEWPAVPTCCQPMGIRNNDEAGFGFTSHMPLHLPTAAAAAEAAAAQHIRIRNADETGFRVCALHSAKHLHTACPGCSCKCEAEDIAVKLPAANIHFFYVSDEEDDGQDSAPKDM